MTVDNKIANCALFCGPMCYQRHHHARILNVESLCKMRLWVFHGDYLLFVPGSLCGRVVVFSVAIGIRRLVVERVLCHTAGARHRTAFFSGSMSFDLTKTETFVPFLWIFFKTSTAIAIFNLFSEDAQRWSIHGKTDGAAADGSVEVQVDVLDRFLSVLLVSLVLCERAVDLCVATRSDVTQKLTRRTLTGLNTHIISDIFAGFCLVHYVETQDSKCHQSSWLLLSTCLWFATGLSVFVYETHLKRRILHHEQPKYSSETTGLSNVGTMLQLVRPFLLYTGMVLLLAISATSSCLRQIFDDMPTVQFCFRLLLYSCYVCCRCYTQGMPGESIIDEMPNIVLLGWIIVLPVMLLYTSILVTIAAYVRLFSSPGKKDTALLPVTAVAGNTSVLVNTHDHAGPVRHHDDHHKNTQETQAELLAKLQNIEQTMQLSGSSAKPTHTAKRRQAPLF